MKDRKRLGPVLVMLLVLGAGSLPARTLRVGSKKFTESYVLGEIAVRLLQRAGFPAEHRPGMGGTIVLWQALKAGQIDVYPEYTGTLREQILKVPTTFSPEQVRRRLAGYGVAMTGSLGFNNTYALVMRRDRADRLGIRTISDLRDHPELVVGLTHEFLRRRDGWVPLQRAYGMHMDHVVGIEHALGYAALRAGRIDVKDAYSTDAKIAAYDLVVLQDDRHFFPRYLAVFLYRADLDPAAVAALRELEGRLDERTMMELNALAERTRDYGAAADEFLGLPHRGTSLGSRLGRWTLRHLVLVSVSMLLAILLGIPLGIRAARGDLVGRGILGLAGMIYTIPSLALLALLVPVPYLGIRATTAIVALFLYSLLPIVRNTATGLQDISPGIRESAEALGLEPRARLVKIYLPMASRTILAGIKTSAVINVGTATLAALIGAGGLGEPIISGLNLNDHRTILEGAIPAALLALLVQVGFDVMDRLLIPRGLRLSSDRGP